MEINEIFGSRIFNDTIMRSRLPESVYKSLKATSRLGKPLDPEIADVVATAMKDWAISQGATHFTHWFQPLNNLTAGKHDSFLTFTSLEKDKVVSEFTASALVRGEPDASSFPSGGLRNTFEARGYTAWDPTSPVFIRDGSLYIPTAFCSYTGEALDTKTPLLRAMQALSPQGLRLLRALQITSSRVVMPTVGAEQEYFLVDRQLYEQRLDLKLCGRTLMGAKPPKGQELDDHYCGRLRLRVADFMRDLDARLWALGIPAKTKHNEAAPAQHELAPIFETVNIACDNNLLTMELMRITAKEHGLACLLHEKPFSWVNGSGKHNNFSISTDDGINFLNPGKHPEENCLFLLTLCAIIESLDNHAGLVRLAAACPGNDHRLGGFEAPPAIISMFLGEELSAILYSIAQGVSPSIHKQPALNTDIDILPSLSKDDADRNRTSPFAFTGNKFEFRMLGSSQSIAFVNVVLTTAVADVFSRFADRLEACDDLEMETARIISDTIRDHGRVIFNGNNYAPEWMEEARRRGLPILPATADAADCMIASESIALFARHGVLGETECRARYEVILENCVKVISIEAETMIQMVRRQIFPAAVAYTGRVAKSLREMDALGVHCKAVKDHLLHLTGLLDQLSECCAELESLYRQPNGMGLPDGARHAQDKIRPCMNRLRHACDALEEAIPSTDWPMPVYSDLLYRV